MRKRDNYEIAIKGLKRNLVVDKFSKNIVFTKNGHVQTRPGMKDIILPYNPNYRAPYIYRPIIIPPEDPTTIVEPPTTVDDPWPDPITTILQYILAVFPVGDGETVPVGAELYDEEDVIEMSASPNAPAVFRRWRGDVEDRDLSAYANPANYNPATSPRNWWTDMPSSALTFVDGWAKIAVDGRELNAGEKIYLWYGFYDEIGGTVLPVYSTKTAPFDDIFYLYQKESDGEIEISMTLSGSGPYERTIYQEALPTHDSEYIGPYLPFPVAEEAGLLALTVGKAQEMKMGTQNRIIAGEMSDASQFVLYIAVIGNGKVDPVGINFFNEGAEITIFQEAAEGWTFNSDDSDSLTVLMDSDKIVMVIFDQDEEEIDPEDPEIPGEPIPPPPTPTVSYPEANFYSAVSMFYRGGLCNIRARGPNPVYILCSEDPNDSYYMVPFGGTEMNATIMTALSKRTNSSRQASLLTYQTELKDGSFDTRTITHLLKWREMQYGYAYNPNKYFAGETLTHNLATKDSDGNWIEITVNQSCNLCLPQVDNLFVQFGAEEEEFILEPEISGTPVGQRKGESVFPNRIYDLGLIYTDIWENLSLRLEKKDSSYFGVREMLSNAPHGIGDVKFQSLTSDIMTINEDGGNLVTVFDPEDFEEKEDVSVKILLSDRWTGGSSPSDTWPEVEGRKFEHIEIKFKSTKANIWGAASVVLNDVAMVNVGTISGNLSCFYSVLAGGVLWSTWKRTSSDGGATWSAPVLQTSPSPADPHHISVGISEVSNSFFSSTLSGIFENNSLRADLTSALYSGIGLEYGIKYSEDLEGNYFLSKGAGETGFGGTRGATIFNNGSINSVPVAFTDLLSPITVVRWEGEDVALMARRGAIYVYSFGVNGGLSRIKRIYKIPEGVPEGHTSLSFDKTNRYMYFSNPYSGSIGFDCYRAKFLPEEELS